MSAYAGVGIALLVIGLYASITRTNLLQIIIGLEIMARGVCWSSSSGRRQRHSHGPRPW